MVGGIGKAFQIASDRGRLQFFKLVQFFFP